MSNCVIEEQKWDGDLVHNKIKSLQFLCNLVVSLKHIGLENYTIFWIRQVALCTQKLKHMYRSIPSIQIFAKLNFQE